MTSKNFMQVGIAAVLSPKEVRRAGDPYRRRIESIAIDPVRGRLSWTVSRGGVDSDGNYRPSRLPESRYQADLEGKLIRHRGRTRALDAGERERLMPLLAGLVLYASDTTECWEATKGQPVPSKEVPRGCH